MLGATVQINHFRQTLHRMLSKLVKYSSKLPVVLFILNFSFNIALRSPPTSRQGGYFLCNLKVKGAQTQAPPTQKPTTNPPINAAECGRRKTVSIIYLHT